MFENIVSNLKDLAQEIASFSELNDTTSSIDAIIRNVDAPILIMVMGEFSTGKSSFINALVEKEIAIVNAKPTTAVITKLCYGLEDRITVYFLDGEHKEYNIEDFSALTVEDEATVKLRENIDYVERALPLEMLKSMTIIDSPGLNSLKKSHETTTRQFMDNSDTVIWIFDAHDPCKQTEIDAMKRLNPRLSPLVLVNKMDSLDEEDSPEKILSEVSRKLRNNRLEVQDVIGVSAKLAFRGKQENNEKWLFESNIDEFQNMIETVILPRREEYKRNAMFDNLAQILFNVGTALISRKSDNDKQKDTDYATYIENEETLALTMDALENLTDSFLEFFNLSRNSFSDVQVNKLKLNASERTVFGVLYWLGIATEKNTPIAQKHLEAAAVRNDNIAQIIMAEVYDKLGQESKAKYWRTRLGMKESPESEEEQRFSSNVSDNGTTMFTSQSISGKFGYGMHIISNLPEKLTKATAKRDNKKIRVVVIGEFSRGKSTFINALLGQRILPSAKNPTTAFINKIVYGDKPEYYITYKNGQRKGIDQDDYLKLVASSNTLGLGGMVAAMVFGKLPQTFIVNQIKFAEIYHPFCRKDVEIIDTPGTNDLNNENLENIYGYINTSDILILMLSACQSASMSELEFIRNLVHNGERREMIFVLSNKDSLENGQEQSIVTLFSDEIKSVLPDFDLQNHIFLVNSKGALLYRRQQNGEVLKSNLQARVPANFDDTGFPAVEAALENIISRME